MAWYNINNSDGIAKEFDQKNRVQRCGFCGQEKKIKTEEKREVTKTTKYTIKTSVYAWY